MDFLAAFRKLWVDGLWESEVQDNDVEMESQNAEEVDGYDQLNHDIQKSGHSVEGLNQADRSCDRDSEAQNSQDYSAKKGF